MAESLTVLITGGAGFIGSHLAAAWCEQGARVRVLDNLRTGRRENLDGLEVEFLQGSITDETMIRAAVRGVDVVHHLAALVSVPESVAKPIETERINVEGTILLLEASADAGVKRFVFSSSSAVYGNVERDQHSESDIPAPASPYAISKLTGEHYVSLMNGRNGMGTVSLRYFNVFGPRQDPRSPYAAAVSIFTARALRNEPITIYGDGEQTRDFIFVGDVVAANLLVAERGSGVYNVGRGSRITIIELAKIIRTLVGSNSPLVHGPERAGDVRHSCANPECLRKLGWRPQVPLEQGLEQTISWMRQPTEQKEGGIR